MTEPADPDDIVKRTLGSLKSADKDHERLRKRIKRMALFEDHTYVPYKGAGQRLKKKAVRQGSDPPSVQLMIERRNRYEAIADRIASINKMLLDKTDPKEIEILTRTIATLEKIADGHLSAIETVLKSISHDSGMLNTNRAKLLTSAAQLSQSDRHHQEKLALAKSQNPSDLSEAELLKIVNAEEAPADADA